MADTPTEVTRLLRQAAAGDRTAFTRLFPLVYEELKALARHKLTFEREGHTLGATGLVHEAYLKLAGQADTDWHGRAHFMAVAAQAMRPTPGAGTGGSLAVFEHATGGSSSVRAAARSRR